MKRVWLIRKDQGAVSPVIATILMVAITVVLAAVLYVMVSAFVIPPKPKEVIFTISTTGENWSMLVTATSDDSITLSSTTLSIFDENGNPKLNFVQLSQLTKDNWDVNKAYYLQKGTDSTIKAGDRILIDRETYQKGYSYELIDDTGLLTKGTF